ncbi:hypothetical protein ACFE04_008912 [Oxalis oulophora]
MKEEQRTIAHSITSTFPNSTSLYWRELLEKWALERRWSYHLAFLDEQGKKSLFKPATADARNREARAKCTLLHTNTRNAPHMHTKVVVVVCFASGKNSVDSKIEQRRERGLCYQPLEKNFIGFICRPYLRIIIVKINGSTPSESSDKFSFSDLLSLSHFSLVKDLQLYKSSSELVCRVNRSFFFVWLIFNMSGSRKSLQRAAQTFNPRAENSWSKDDTKFGQKMLEKMGWKKGEGIGRDGQGVTENIKIRWKLDSKGLGFSIKEDEWVAVEHDFSSLLSNLNKDCSSSRTKTTKLSLESTSSSSRSRVHYRKFIRGKDISKYSKKDLSGILGRNAEVGEEYNSNLSENQTDSGSAGTSKQLHDDEEFEDRVNGDSSFRNDSENVESNETPVSELRVPSVKKRKKTKVDSNEDDFNNSIQKVTENDLSHKKTNGSTKRKKSLITSDQLHVDEISEEIASDDAILRNGSENVESNETQASEEKRPSVKKQRKNKIVSNMDNFHDSVQEVPMIDLTDNKKSDRSAKRKKSLNTSDQLHVDDDKSVEIANDDLIPRNDCESVKSNKTLASELGPSVKKRRKNKIVSNVDGFDDSVQISPVIDLTDYKSDDCSTKLIKSLDTNDQLNADSDKPSAKKRRKNKEFSNVDDFDDSIRNVLSDVKDIHSARQIESSDICDQLLVEKSEEVADSDSNLRNDSENTESNKTLDSELRGLSVKKRRKNKVVSSKDDFDASVQTVSFIDLTDHKTDDCSAKRIKSLDTNDQLHVDNESEEVAEDNSNLRNGPTNAESDETQASKSKRHSAKKRRKNEKVLNVDDFVPLVSMNDHSDNKN